MIGLKDAYNLIFCIASPQRGRCALAEVTNEVEATLGVAVEVALFAALLMLTGGAWVAIGQQLVDGAHLRGHIMRHTQRAYLFLLRKRVAVSEFYS